MKLFRDLSGNDQSEAVNEVKKRKHVSPALEAKRGEDAVLERTARGKSFKRKKALISLSEEKRKRRP